LDVTEISRIERGSREVRLTTLMRLVDALGAPPQELLSGLRLPVRTTHSDESPQQAADAL
jgi:transcriptional regulator with XRE-family HTH domain